MILRQIPSKDITRTSQWLLLVTAALVLPVSSRLVAQDDAADKPVEKPAAARLEAVAPEKAEAAADTDEKPKVEIPRGGILEVEVAAGGKTTKAKSIKAAIAQLRLAARRIGQGENFSAAINVNGTAREFDSIQEAVVACTALERILDTAKKSRIALGELGRIEHEQLPAISQQTPAPRLGRDGDDGLGAGGGLGGPAGGGGFGAHDPFGLAALAGARGQSKEQLIPVFRQAIAKILIEEDRQQNGPDATDSAPGGVARSGKATLFSRLANRNYEKATFSFEFALRDDPNRITGNDWDLQYGNVPNHFHVTMVSDDRSRIVDLGQTTFEQLDVARLDKLPASPRPQRDFVPAVVGHVYLVHTVDRNTDLYALFRVEQINADQSCDISWLRIAAPGSEEPKKAELQQQP